MNQHWKSYNCCSYEHMACRSIGRRKKPDYPSNIAGLRAPAHFIVESKRDTIIFHLLMSHSGRYSIWWVLGLSYYMNDKWSPIPRNSSVFSMLALLLLCSWIFQDLLPSANGIFGRKALMDNYNVCLLLRSTSFLTC